MLDCSRTMCSGHLLICIYLHDRGFSADDRISSPYFASKEPEQRINAKPQSLGKPQADPSAWALVRLASIREPSSRLHLPDLRRFVGMNSLHGLRAIWHRGHAPLLHMYTTLHRSDVDISKASLCDIGFHCSNKDPTHCSMRATIPRYTPIFFWTALTLTQSPSPPPSPFPPVR